MLEGLKSRLENNEIKCSFTDSAISKIAESGFDPVYGARPLRRAIQSDIEDMLEKVSGVTMDDVVAVADKLSFHTVFFLKGTAEEGDYDEE